MSTNNLIGNIMGSSAQPEPKVGDGATILFWTDRVAGTIIEVSKNAKQIVVQEDKATKNFTGMTDAQSYTYEPDPNGQTWTFTLRKNGRWVRKGEDLYRGQRVSIGHRSKFYDYSF